MRQLFRIRSRNRSFNSPLQCWSRELVAGIGDPDSNGVSPRPNSAADTAAATDLGTEAVVKKRLAGEGAAVHSATQN
jgi:hypothetical protein